MSIRFGRRYGHLRHGPGCACHNPQLHELFSRLDERLSHRPVLKGAAASLAAPAPGMVHLVAAKKTQRTVLRGFTRTRLPDRGEPA